MRFDEKFKNLSDRELVDQLLLNNSDAWQYVCVDIIGPMTKTTKYREIFYRYSLPIEDIVGQVYLDLIDKDFSKLRKFRFDGSFQAWLFFQIKDSVKKIFRIHKGKIPLCLSETPYEFSHIKQEEISNNLIDKKASYEEVNYYFAELWKENPMKAYVLLLRIQNGLSSKDVGVILNKSSENIDQLNKRAKQQLREIRANNHEL